MTCLTTSDIYCIQCKTCSKQYIGQTSNSICERFYGHLNDIRNKARFKPIPQHFSSEGHSINDVTITGVRKTVANTNVRLGTEEALIHHLKTRTA